MVNAISILTVERLLDTKSFCISKFWYTSNTSITLNIICKQVAKHFFKLCTVISFPQLVAVRLLRRVAAAAAAGPVFELHLGQSLPYAVWSGIIKFMIAEPRSRGSDSSDVQSKKGNRVASWNICATDTIMTFITYTWQINCSEIDQEKVSPWHTILFIQRLYNEKLFKCVIRWWIVVPAWEFSRIIFK